VLAGLASGHVDVVYFDADAADSNARARAVLDAASAAGVPSAALAGGVLRTVTDAQHPQPVAATARPSSTGDASGFDEGFVLVLCDVADPGNLGTAIRSADAAGTAGVVVCGDGVDVGNPKVLRATAGSVFQLPVAVVATPVDAATALRGSGRRVLGAVVRGGTPLWSARLDGATAVVVGSESTGLAPALLDRLDGGLSIPMAGHAESLNAGVAASIVCFESLRQRAAGDGPPRRASTI
jgi:TrmH family RNA methyltransferase